MAGIVTARAAIADLDDLVPLFDAYRGFYEASSDRAAARAFLTDRIERDESVIFLAYAAPHLPVGLPAVPPFFLPVLPRARVVPDRFLGAPRVRRGGGGGTFSGGARQ